MEGLFFIARYSLFDIIIIVQQIQEDAEIIMESETLSTKCPVSFDAISSFICLIDQNFRYSLLSHV